MSGAPPLPESYWERAVRKSTSEPLVPLGALITVIFLSAGLRSFHRGNKLQAQNMMRGRVIAQGVTILAMGYGAYAGFKPHNRPKDYEERLDKIHEENASRPAGWWTKPENNLHSQSNFASQISDAVAKSDKK
jgi:hypothetical protein